MTGVGEAMARVANADARAADVSFMVAVEGKEYDCRQRGSANERSCSSASLE
jgi:hypothetical protein